MLQPSSETKRMHKLEMELLFITVNRAVGVWLHMRSILNYQAALFQDAEKERQLLSVQTCFSFLSSIQILGQAPGPNGDRFLSSCAVRVESALTMLEFLQAFPHPNTVYFCKDLVSRLHGE